MKILYFSQNPLTRALGAPKVLLELADAMNQIGWESHFIQASELGVGTTASDAPHAQQALRRYLQENAGNFDVVEYDHGYLPFPRSEFSTRPLLVARSVLLIQHTFRLPIPQPNHWKDRIRKLVRSRARARYKQWWLDQADLTCRSADLINVSNDDDKKELIRDGLPPEKIIVLPFGISRARHAAMSAIPIEPPAEPVVGFVGTFEPRKGSLDFPRLVELVARSIPAVRFRLLGVTGQADGEARVRAAFPAALQSNLQVVTKFAPDDLPSHLAGVSVGVFPSYLEGFGIGVLEMLAAGIPVIAYNVPGPPMMLPIDRLVPAGAIEAMAQKLIELLKSPSALSAARHESRASSRQFTWEQIAVDTDRVYRDAIVKRHSQS